MCSLRYRQCVSENGNLHWSTRAQGFCFVSNCHDAWSSFFAIRFIIPVGIAIKFKSKLFKLVGWRYITQIILKLNFTSVYGKISLYICGWICQTVFDLQKVSSSLPPTINSTKATKLYDDILSVICEVRNHILVYHLRVRTAQQHTDRFTAQKAQHLILQS